jgi:four helix bundle protein
LKAESGNEEKEEEELKLEKNMREGRLPLEFRDRAKSFAAMAIRLYVKLPKDREEVRVCGKQLLRAGTSVAAHVREASRARSDAEFISKLGGALQETDETQLWLELLSEECRIQSSLTNPMRQEADELIAIMTTMVRRTEEKQKAENRKLK